MQEYPAIIRSENQYILYLLNNYGKYGINLLQKKIFKMKIILPALFYARLFWLINYVDELVFLDDVQLIIGAGNIEII